ncbi:hypothetical protein CPAR01_15883 [Colletotrichum paranaense]|uniref:Uncharacterized protein n=2 Tax=Colletotrichum acutatum species complex TaxID=2707335 RepID=A0AAI9U130_9PEZI|nr:uncharacterized protein CPAR01_15883 [Colletotrichum paranaense]KAK1447785.1 hypothetical protein CMEL01_09624 [Colletotrichum melonis]KAK1518234.1 hypothetical protein CPAR01_15883 [Colletotrichum paranaense]
MREVLLPPSLPSNEQTSPVFAKHVCHPSSIESSSQCFFIHGAGIFCRFGNNACSRRSPHCEHRSRVWLCVEGSATVINLTILHGLPEVILLSPASLPRSSSSFVITRVRITR